MQRKNAQKIKLSLLIYCETEKKPKWPPKSSAVLKCRFLAPSNVSRGALDSQLLTRADARLLLTDPLRPNAEKNAAKTRLLRPIPGQLLSHPDKEAQFESCFSPSSSPACRSKTTCSALHRCSLNSGAPGTFKTESKLWQSSSKVRMAAEW